MKKNIIWSIIIVVIAIFFMHYRAHNSVSQNSTQTVFVVNKGDDIVTIGNKLEKKKLISRNIYFYYYAWKNKLRGQISAGSYNISPNSSIGEIVHKITKGDAIIEKKQDIKVTFPEGWTNKKMADRLNKYNLPGDEFLKLANNPDENLYSKYLFLQRGASLEGYLYPDTYFFLVDANATNIIEKMLRNFENKVGEGRKRQIADMGSNLRDVLTLASIVEGEVHANDDRHIVAGIFKNRLDINMALQSDATIDYIKGIPEIKHTLADTKIDSPYNTYKYLGLPPGPINNPSIKSIDAVLEPVDTDYMYFLNNAETGETVFSKTFAEHVNNKGKNGL